ncbi:hypothetical protein HDR59_00715 [bacterium]|nr:hypothetical protein [bacterium]
MKKILFSLLTFITLFSSKVSFAAPTDVKEGLKGCWECNIIEGVYIYVFNFVYKIYAVLVPIVRNLLWLTLAFWFIWYVWTNVIKEQKGSIGSMLKDVFIKLFTYTFVLAMLELPAKTIFKYSIDIIMNAGPNFARWVLEEARADTEMFKLSDGNIRKFSCNDIKLSSYAQQALNNYAKTNAYGDDYNEEEETLTNLLCVTREYTNTFNSGTDLGFKIMARSVIAMGEFKVLKLTYDSPLGQGLEAGIMTALGAFSWIYVIVMFFIKLWLALTFLANTVTLFVGLCIAVGFLYIQFTYLIIIFDVVIKLAMVGVMMPITLGSWTFHNTRKKLSGTLFWDVVKCTFRLGFLSVSMTISTYLLNELLTTTFNAGPFDITLTSLLEHLSGNGKILTASTFLDGINLLSDKNKILFTIITNPTIIISTMFVCLLSFTMLSKSISLADKFSNAIGSGVQQDQILNGLKKLTISTIKYITSGVKREFKSNLKYNWVNDKVNNSGSNTKKKELNKKVREGEDITLYDLPIDEAVKLYEDNANLDEINEKTEQPNLYTEDDYKNVPQEYKSMETKDLQQQYNNLRNKEAEQHQNESKIIDEAFKNYESYNKLTPEEKERVYDDIINLNGEFDNEITKSLDSPQYNEFINEIKSNTTATNNPAKEINKIIANKELENTIRNDKTISPPAQKRIIKYLNNGGQISASDKKILDNAEIEVKSNRKKEATKIANIMIELENRKNLSKKTSKSNKSEIKAKDMYKVLKQDEFDDLTREIDEISNGDITAVSRLKISQLKRQLNKLEKEMDALNEYDDETVEEMTEREIKKYKRRKSKIKSPRMQKENSRIKNDKV